MLNSEAKIIGNDKNSIARIEKSDPGENHEFVALLTVIALHITNIKGRKFIFYGRILYK